MIRFALGALCCASLALPAAAHHKGRHSRVSAVIKPAPQQATAQATAEAQPTLQPISQQSGEMASVERKVRVILPSPYAFK